MICSKKEHYKKKVYIACLNEGWLRVELSNLLTNITHDGRYRVKIVYPNNRPVDNNHNKTVRKFLKTDFDYLMIFGADGCPTRNPLDLIELNKDIIVCPTLQWNDSDADFPLYWVAMDKVENGWKEHKEKKGLQEVDATGSANMIIARRVLEGISAPFMREWDKDGIAQTGLDFNFCQKAKEKGFRVWVHYDYPSCHFKEINLLDIYRLLVNKRRQERIYITGCARSGTTLLQRLFYAFEGVEIIDGEIDIDSFINRTSDKVLVGKRTINSVFFQQALG